MAHFVLRDAAMIVGVGSDRLAPPDLCCESSTQVLLGYIVETARGVGEMGVPLRQAMLFTCVI